MKNREKECHLDQMGAWVKGAEKQRKKDLAMTRSAEWFLLRKAKGGAFYLSTNSVMVLSTLLILSMRVLLIPPVLMPPVLIPPVLIPPAILSCI